jgi:hypothetical protein
VFVNLAPLAAQAGPGHQSYGLGHLWPAEPRGDEAAGRSHPWVVYSMQRLDMLIGTSGRKTPVETSPSSGSSPTAWVVICSVVEFIISATSVQDRCTAAIAAKSIGWALAMAAKMGCSGAASPSSGQSSAARAGDVGWPGGRRCAAAEGGRHKVESAVVAAVPPRPVLLADHVQRRRPGRIGTADDAGRLQFAELGFRLAQLVRIQEAGLGKHEASCCLNGVADLVLRRWFSFSVADDGWEHGQQGPYRRCYGAEGGGELGV